MKAFHNNHPKHFNPSRPDPGRIEKTIYFHNSCGGSKRFMKVLKAFRKPFEAPQRRVKIKI